MKRFPEICAIALTTFSFTAQATTMPAPTTGSGTSVTPSGGVNVTGKVDTGKPDAMVSSKTSPLPPVGNWGSEDAYWRNQYPSRPYYSTGTDYSAYAPAYHYGVDMYNRNPGRRYEDLNQSEVSSGWDRARGDSTLSWTNAEPAVRDAYDRLYNHSVATPAAPTAFNPPPH